MNAHTFPVRTFVKSEAERVEDADEAWAMPTARAASLRPQPATPSSQSGIPIAGRVSRTAIDRAFAPLSKALLREGRPTAEAVIAGFRVTATRRRNLHVRYGGCAGAAWLVHYEVEGIGSGERCHMVEAICRAVKATGAA